MCGKYSPPMGEFSDEEQREFIAAINRAKPDVLWVGMTAPKQEKWIAKNLARLDVAVAAGIGAEFDYFAGTKKRPAEWISRTGLQWVHRLIQEPRRTWRRQLVSAPWYLVSVIWWKIPGDLSAGLH